MQSIDLYGQLTIIFDGIIASLLIASAIDGDTVRQ